MQRHYLLLLCAFLAFPQFACQSKKQAKISETTSDAQAMETCLALSKKKKFQEAIECLEILKSRYPDSTYALDAELNIADNYFKNKEWTLAAESYNLYAKLHPNNPKLDYAYYRAGLAYEKTMPKAIDRDMTSSGSAEESFAAVFRRFPESPHSADAQAKFDRLRSRTARREMYVGNFYYKYGEYRAAIPRYLGILQDYPGLGFDETALRRLILSYRKLGLADKAEAATKLLQEKFPEGKGKRKAQ